MRIAVIVIALCASACEPAGLGVELPVVEGARAMLIGVYAASGSEYSALVAFDPSTLEGYSAVEALELDAPRIDALVSPCTISELGLDLGSNARDARGRALAWSRCALSLDLLAVEVGWKSEAAPPRAASTYTVEDTLVSCAAEQLAAECE